MFNAVKVFIELHKDLIAKEDWKKFYQAAYDIKLPNYQVEELLHIFESVNISTAVNVRNELLFDEVKDCLEVVKENRQYNFDPSIRDTFVSQFIRSYLVNMFGFTLEETMELMCNNQKLLGIELIPTNKHPGQNGVQNYEITFVN